MNGKSADGGAVVFIPPLFIGGGYARQAKAPVVILACVIASAAAIRESVCILQSDTAE